MSDKKIVIIAGEDSGDLHGSHLMKEMKKIDPAFSFYGVGGDKMIREGLNNICLLYTSPSPRDGLLSRMPSSA